MRSRERGCSQLGLARLLCLYALCWLEESLVIFVALFELFVKPVCMGLGFAVGCKLIERWSK